ncbi:hypothetical protein D3C84_344830 [compost metagenome]
MTRRAGLQPQGFVEQDHFEQLTVHREERQDRKPESPTAAHQAALDVILPGCRMAPVVHPYPKPQHHDAGKQRRRTFQQLSLGTANVDHVRRERPGTQAGQQRQPPSDVDTAHRRLLTGIAQERKDRRQHQDRFQAFAQQNQQTRDVTQGPAETIAAQQAGGLLQFRLGHVQSLFSLLDR